MNLFNMFTKIKETKGLKAKQALVKEYSPDDLFISTIKFLLDDDIKTNIKTNKINKEITAEGLSLNNISEFLDYLANKSTGKDVDIATIQTFINQYEDYNVRNFLKEIATKSFTLGIGVKSINPVVQIFKHRHEVQLANKYSDRYDKVIEKYPTSKFFITQKLDGIRASVIVENGAIRVVSRQNKQFSGLSSLFESFCSDGMYDGELIIPNMTFNEIQSVVMSEENTNKDSVEFHVFDKISLDDYYNKKSSETYEKRRAKLKQEFTDVFTDASKIKLVPIIGLALASTLDQTILNLEATVTENNWEGLMVNVGDAKYECKRTDAILKVKKFDTVDLEIIGFNEGEGEKAGMLGSFICKYEDNTVDVSGFSNEIAIDVWNNKEKYVGKVIEVKYFQASKNKDGKKSLRHPNFLHFRHDK